ncbi:MAG: MMPL family transporter, partial [Pseudomonadales bacterium]|nr:MMPL family transporter [Pseudomonadales bacterium]
MEITLSQQAIRFRWPLFVLTLLLVLVASYGMKYFQFDGSPKAFVDEDDQGLNLLNSLEETFGRTNNAVILIGPKAGVQVDASTAFMFQRQQLQLLTEFTEKAWLIPHAHRVDSIINHPHSWGQDDELYVESLLEELDNLTAADIEHARQVLTQEISVVDRLLTADGNHAGLMIRFSLQEGDQDAANEAGAAVYALKKELEEKYPDIAIYPSGTLVNNYVTMELAMTDTAKVVGTMYLVMFVLLAFLLRSVVAMMAIVFVTVMSVIGGLGLSCWGGAVFTSLSLSSISIIITVTIAHCVHLFLGFFQGYRYGMNKKQALLDSMVINLQPVFLTSLTTVVGFLSMNLSEMPTMRDLGNICAAGVTVSFICAYTMLPALITFLPFNQKAKPTG